MVDPILESVINTIDSYVEDEGVSIIVNADEIVKRRFMYGTSVIASATGIGNGCGRVELVEFMGSDYMMTKVAAISYGKEEVANPSKLIRSIVSNGHTSILEQTVFLFKIKCPIMVARHWLRQRMARPNEQSGRYTESSNYYTPGKFRFATDNADVSKIFEDSFSGAEESYKKLRDAGAPKEIGRLVKPVALMTEFYWQIDLNNLMKFLSKRLERNTQLETREYARYLFDFAKLVCPIAMSQFEESVLYASTISKKESEVLAEYLETTTGLPNDIKLLLGKIKNKIGKE